jgi:hypothetical protein
LLRNRAFGKKGPLIDVPFLQTGVMVSTPASPAQLPYPACGYATAQRFLYSKNGCDILRCAECGLGRAQAKGFDPGALAPGRRVVYSS